MITEQTDDIRTSNKLSSAEIQYHYVLQCRTN